MSLKHVKQAFTGSIAAQLTFFYSVATFVLITIITLLLYWAMVHVLYEADRQFVADEIKIVQHILSKNTKDMTALKQEVIDVPSSLQNSVYHYYIRILDHNNYLVVETPTMSSKIPIHFFAAKYQWWQSSTAYYLLKQTHHGQWRIEVALDVSYQHSVIHYYRLIVFAAIFAGALISILLGYLISNRGLRRLSELTRMTKNISANALHQRITAELLPQELQELCHAYNQMLARIEASFLRLTQLADDLAHELRTPINNLLGETEIVLSSHSSIKDYQQLAASNLEELNRIALIVENLLFLARAENPHISLQKSLINAADEIQVMYNYYQAVAEEKNIQIHIEGITTLEVNLTMFRRLIGNLISNAIKYSEPNASIYINVREKENAMVLIEVIDNGIGISFDHLPYIGQRFYRTEAARNHGAGLGLGLAIVQSIVLLHQGKMTISSAANQGTVVTILLPKY